jgi:hypothetical protein
MKSIERMAFSGSQLIELNFVSLNSLESIGEQAFTGNSIISIL